MVDAQMAGVAEGVGKKTLFGMSTRGLLVR